MLWFSLNGEAKIWCLAAFFYGCIIVAYLLLYLEERRTKMLEQSHPDYLEGYRRGLFGEAGPSASGHGSRYWQGHCAALEKVEREDRVWGRGRSRDEIIAEEMIQINLSGDGWDACR